MGKDIKAFSITQPIGTFYVAKMDYKELIEMCTTDMASIKESEYDIYQRKLNEKRIPILREYMEYSKATFPNGIILNSRYPVKFNAEQGMLTVEDREDTFFIIDGQHRIEALKHYNGVKPFEICAIIFESINPDLQTEIFVTVNSEQKKVNPTVKQNLKGNDSVDTPEKVIRKIAIALNEDVDSPFRGRINFTDESVKKGELKLSLAAFMRPLMKKMYKEEQAFQIKDTLMMNGNNRNELPIKGFNFNKPLWDYYVNKEDEIIYLTLLNYFTAISDVLKEDWNDPKSLLFKTSGYDALIMLYCDVLEKNMDDMSYDTLLSQLIVLKDMKGQFTLENVGVGNSAAVRLYHMFEEKLFGEKPDKIDYIEFFEE